MTHSDRTLLWISMVFDKALLLISMVFICYMTPIECSGTVKITVDNWRNPNGQLENGACCSPDCICQAILSVCIGVSNHNHNRNHPSMIDHHPHRDCSLISHRSSEVFTSNSLINASLIVPFTARWPQQGVVSVFVQLLHVDQQVIISSQHNALTLFPGQSRPLTVNEETKNKSFTFTLSVHCDANYFGRECVTFCRENNINRSTFGAHFSCADDGQRVCHPGWTGTGCNLAMCKPECSNGGTCILPNTCSCTTGWHGPSCSECIPLTGCVHGVCNRPNECHCDPFWGGLLCDRDLDMCRHNQPCLNGGQCSSMGLQDFYVCSCAIGWTGRNCSIRRPCLDLNPCDEGEQCKPTGPGPDDYRCECVDCSRRALPHSNTCWHNGIAYRDGQQWTTMDCRKCRCNRGQRNCTEARCEWRDCIASRGIEFQGKRSPAICPSTHPCNSIIEGECLKEPCHFPIGQCIPWQQAGRTAIKCTSETCPRILLRLDVHRLPQGTSVENLCFHLLLVLLTDGLKEYAFDCSKLSSDTVQVDMIPLNPAYPLETVKEVLKNRLRYERLEDVDRHRLRDGNMASPVLNVIFDVRELFVVNDEEKGNGPVLLVAVVLLLLATILALVAIYLLQTTKKWRQKKDDDDVPPPTTNILYRAQVVNRAQAVNRKCVDNDYQFYPTPSNLTNLTIASRNLCRHSLCIYEDQEREMVDNLRNTLRQHRHSMFISDKMDGMVDQIVDYDTLLSGNKNNKDRMLSVNKNNNNTLLSGNKNNKDRMLSVNKNNNNTLLSGNKNNKDRMQLGHKNKPVDPFTVREAVI